MISAKNVGCVPLAFPSFRQSVTGSNGTKPTSYTFQRKKDSAFIGGGTLISAKWVLTAAHSVNYSEFLNISGLVAGSHSPDDDGKTVQRRSALRKIIHPGFKYKYVSSAFAAVYTYLDPRTLRSSLFRKNVRSFFHRATLSSAYSTISR